MREKDYRDERFISEKERILFSQKKSNDAIKKEEHLMIQ